MRERQSSKESISELLSYGIPVVNLNRLGAQGAVFVGAHLGKAMNHRLSLHFDDIQSRL